MLLQEIVQELQDIPRKSPFLLHSCNILQESCCKIPISRKILQECKRKGLNILEFLQYFLQEHFYWAVKKNTDYDIVLALICIDSSAMWNIGMTITTAIGW